MYNEFIGEVHEIKTADGVIYPLSTRRGRWLMSFSGYGAPPVAYSTERGFGQHGVTVVEQHLEERSITLAYEFTAANRGLFWQKRRDLLDILRINRGGDFWLRVWQDANTLREIPARYAGGASFPALDPGSGNGVRDVSDSIELLCGDPVWYGDSYCFGATLAAARHLVSPFTAGAGKTFLSVSKNARIEQSISYLGDWRSWPSLVVTGPANSIRVENLTLGNYAAWFYSVASGESVAIDFSELGPVVTASAGIAFGDAFNAALDAGSYPLGVYVAPDPEVSGGVNQFLVIVGGAVVASTTAVLSYRDRWTGI